MRSQRLFYLNALFDLELGGYPLQKVRQSAIEMGPLFSFCGTANDRLLLDVETDDAYWNYLESLRIPFAPPLNSGDSPALFSGIAWGWNRESVNRFTELGVQCRHPDLDIVQKTNNRSFCAAFNQASGTGVPGTRFCSTAIEVRQAVHDLNNNFPLVAKPAFGGSGMGFVTLESQEDADNRSTRLINNHGCTIEPWCDRVHDLSSSCTIGEDGAIRDLRHYRCYTNRRGMFYGVTFGSETDPVLESWQDELESAVRFAGTALAKTGYWGPVSFDSFVFRDFRSGKEQLAPVIEINSRFFMSAIAHALHEKTGRDRACFFRFVGKKNCPLPDLYDDLKSLLGELSFDSTLRRGVIVLSPLRVLHEKKWVQPVRSAFFIVGNDRDEMLNLDGKLQETIA